MARLEDIIAPVESEFRAFRELLNQVTLSELPFMRPITRDILHSGGKQMRPLLTLLVAALHDDARDPRVQAGAVLIEMIHWSTLVHDDVIDEAYVRRGQWTPGTLLRSKSAVLVGDTALRLGGRLLRRVRVRQDYYWTEGSAQAGLVPASSLVGRAFCVSYSLDPAQPFGRRWRSDRCLSLLP